MMGSWSVAFRVARAGDKPSSTPPRVAGLARGSLDEPLMDYTDHTTARVSL